MRLGREGERKGGEREGEMEGGKGEGRERGREVRGKGGSNLNLVLVVLYD